MSASSRSGQAAGKAVQGSGPAAPAWADPRWLLPAITMLGFSLRLIALRFQPWITYDGTEYVRFAEALAGGVPFVSQFPPGYPAFISLAMALVSDRVLAAGIVSLVCGSLLVLPVWWLARHALGPRWALVPALAVAVHPELCRYSAVVMSESAYLLALYAGLAFVAAGRAFPGGLGLGVAFAVRPEALLPALAVAVRQAWHARATRVRWRTLALGLAAFLVVATPCWVYFRVTHGIWTLTPKVEALRARSESWVLDEPTLEPVPGPVERFGILERLATRGPEAIAGYSTNLPLHARSTLALWPIPLLLLSVAGLWRRRGIESIPLLHLAVLPLFGVSEQPRFVLSLVPALAILAAIPLARASRATWRWGLGFAMLAGLAWAWITFRPTFARPYDAYLAPERDAGLWLLGASEEGDVVAGRKPFVAFYARRPYRPMPDASYEDLIAHAVRTRVRYLVLPEGVTHVFRPQLAPLLVDRAFYEREQRLELVYVGGYVRGYDVFIFKVLQPGETRSGAPPRMNLKSLPASPSG